MTNPTIPTLPNNCSVMDAAFAYIRAGLWIGPLKAGTKHPGSVMGDTWHERTFNDAESVATWFAGSTADYGVFLHAGRSGLVIIDVDYPELVPEFMHAALRSAPFHASRANVPGKGHYLFLQPPGRDIGNSNGQLGREWGQVRGRNGVIVLEPSPHPDAATGGHYHWVRRGEIPYFPEGLAALLPDATPGMTAASRQSMLDFFAQCTEERKPWLFEELMKRFANEASVGSRHDAAVTAATWLARESAAGLYAAQPSFYKLGEAFLDMIGTDRDARFEYADIVAWSIGQLTAERIDEVRRKHPPRSLAAEVRAHDFPPGPPAVRHFAPAPPSSPPLAAAQVPPMSASLPPTAPPPTWAPPAPPPSAPDPAAAQVSPPVAESEERVEPASWSTIDLDGFLTGEHEPVKATLMRRTDGVCLLYPGLVHSFHGESESGKSFVAQATVAAALEAGQRCLYVDFESDPASIVSRFLELGVSPANIKANLDYRRPEVGPNATPAEAAAWMEMMSGRYAIVVIDGVTDSLGLWSLKSTDNDEVSRWMQQFPRRLAARTYAAVVLIDHVAKDKETRGRFAIGAQAKMAGLDGAGYVVDVIDPLGRGMRGVLAIRVGKDRPGQVRQHGGPMRKGDRTQLVAEFVLDATGDRLAASFEVPSDSHPRFRPTGYMERISTWLATHAGANKSAIRSAISGRAAVVDTALELLIEEGYVEAKRDGNATLHAVLHSYVERMDPILQQQKTSTVHEPAGLRVVSCSCPNGQYGLHAPECRHEDAESA